MRPIKRVLLVNSLCFYLDNMAPTGNFSDDAINSVKNMLIQKYQVSLSHSVTEKYNNYYFRIL
jgi:hypothetical protein